MKLQAPRCNPELLDKARRITYVRATNQITVDGIQYFEFTSEDLENARRPTPVR